MKSSMFVLALLVAAGWFSPSIAEASCQSDCLQAFRNCGNAGRPADECKTERSACLLRCNGGPRLGELVLGELVLGELVLGEQATEQSCVIGFESESAAPWGGDAPPAQAQRSSE